MMNSLEITLATLDSAALKTSYKLGTIIDSTQDPLRARIYCLAIPIICFICESVKLTNDLYQVIVLAAKTLSEMNPRIGNIQATAVHITEHLRNTAGIITGIFVAIYSPTLARKTFLINPATDLQKKLNDTTAAQLYGIGHLLIHFYNKYEIQYRACSGTILGAIRNGGVFPHDDDIDTAVHPSSIPKLRELIQNHTFSRETGLAIEEQDFTGGWECFIPGSPKGEGKLAHIGTPFIDIFRTVINEEEGRIDYESEEMRLTATEDYFSFDEWNDVATYELGPIKVLGPANPHPYLFRCYGNDCLEFAHQTMHHEELAKMFDNPLDIKGHYEKLVRYGLPHRTFIIDKSPIKYDPKVYNAVITA